MAMRQLRRNRQLAIILLIGSFFFSACSGLMDRVPKKEKDLKADEALKLLSALKNQNHDLKTFKGVGRITLYRYGKKNLSNRIAWVGSVPNRLRTVLSSVTGRPVLSFASDGRWFYVFDHSQTQFYKQRAKNSIMKKALPVSINSDDMISILAGRIPVHKHHSVILIKDNDSHKAPLISSQRQTVSIHPDQSRDAEDGYILALKGGWGNIYEKIYLHANKKDIRKIEVFDVTGALAYRAEFNNVLNVNGYQIPSVIVFSDDEGSGFQLDVERYWPHVHVSSSLFVLSPPE